MFQYFGVSVSVCKTHILILFTHWINTCTIVQFACRISAKCMIIENVIPKNLDCGWCGRHAYVAFIISSLGVYEQFSNDNMEKLVLVSVKEFTELLLKHEMSMPMPMWHFANKEMKHDRGLYDAMICLPFVKHTNICKFASSKFANGFLFANACNISRT